ncbi:hypothetical protein XM38_005640 [Halomicronema hongdechloris C2206]|uniref:Uncharacterized protein n=1 Tax=Halomicronema hongdechloris C2206 TaxID=1641165 RepID=A0A1Z3HH80_9CYAN|nr:hypothetical protein XM38_005640 [Halomicronema hongdechloris C2206]
MDEQQTEDTKASFTCTAMLTSPHEARQVLVTYIISKKHVFGICRSSNVPGWEKRMLMPSGGLTDILAEEWTGQDNALAGGSGT